MPSRNRHTPRAFAGVIEALRFLIESGVITMSDARDVALGLRRELRAEWRTA